MDNLFHAEWYQHLKQTANTWHNKFKYDEDEALSILLVWYAKALNDFDPSKNVKFDTLFFEYKKCAFSELARDSKKWSGITLDNDILDMFVSSSDAIHNLIIELDKVSLSEDAQKLLEFILTTDLTEDKKHNRIGKRTVMDKATKALNWTYRRTEEALNLIGNFYMERLAV